VRWTTIPFRTSDSMLRTTSADQRHAWRTRPAPTSQSSMRRNPGGSFGCSDESAARRRGGRLLGRPRARRRGVARRAATAVTQWALDDIGFARVELLAATGNTGSRRVAERIGFTRRVLRSAAAGRGRRDDLVMYSRVAGD